MKNAVIVEVDAKDVISGRVRITALVKECSAKKAELLIKNTILFFDEDHPGYSELFDAILSGCDGANVEVRVEGMDDAELLPDDFMKAMARLSFELYGFKKDDHGVYHIS